MNKPPISNSDYAISIGIMLSAALSLALTGFFGKELTSLASLNTVVLIRFLAPFLMLVWISTCVLDEHPFAQGVDKVDWLRAISATLAQYCLFFYLSYGSLLIAALLFSTSGLFLPFITGIYNREPVRKRTLMACAISFVGVGFILKPTSGLNPYMVIGLLSGFFGACSQFFMHMSSKTENTVATTTKMFGLSSIFVFVVFLLTGDFSEVGRLAAADAKGFYLLLIILLFSIATISSQTLRTKAYRFVNRPASLSPFLYTNLIFAGLLDWWVFHKIPDWNTYTGAGLIVIGGLIQAIRPHPYKPDRRFSDVG